MTPPIALTIGGSDSGGGAGIQADLKTFLALRVHGCSLLSTLRRYADVLGCDLQIQLVPRPLTPPPAPAPSPRRSPG